MHSSNERDGADVIEQAELGVEYVPSLEHLLKRSDVVSLHCPLTPATTHLIDAPQLAMMKKGSYLVNTGAEWASNGKHACTF